MKWIQRYQNIIGAAVISLTLLGSTFMVGRYFEHLAMQHDQIIKDQSTIIASQKQLLDIYLRNK